MNKKLLTIGMTTVLTLSIGTQIFHEIKQQKLTNEIAQLQNELFEKNDGITEEFEITEIIDAHVRGEKTEGTGEGIVYTERFFAETVGEIAVGDVVQITWDKQSYENENWDNVERIERIIK